MLSVPIHKDLTDYRPKVFFGLTTRTLVCVALALVSAVALALWAYFALGIPFARMRVAVFLASAPFWALGFMRPNGLVFEKWLPLFIRYRFGDSELTYVNGKRYGVESLVGGEGKARDVVTKTYKKLRQQRTIERWEPGGETD